MAKNIGAPHKTNLNDQELLNPADRTRFGFRASGFRFLIWEGDQPALVGVSASWSRGFLF
jgi:hypothetical protein